MCLADQDLDCVTLEDLIDKLFRNVDNKLPPYTAQYSRRERPQINSGRSLKPRISASAWTLRNSFSIFLLGGGGLTLLVGSVLRVLLRIITELTNGI